MMNESNIRAQLVRYLSADQSYRDFDNWLVDQMSERYLDNPQEVRDLVADIRSLMFEYLDGLIDEPRLKQELRSFAEFYTAEAQIVSTVSSVQRPYSPFM